MTFENQPGSVTGMSDDQLGTIAIALVLSELEWSPDVAPAVMDRISRDAIAYPEQFDRRPAPTTAPPEQPESDRSASRTLGRILVFGVLMAVVVALVFVAATANAARAAVADLATISLEFDEVARGFDQPVHVVAAGDGSGQLYVVEQPGRARIVEADGSTRAEPFLDLSSAVTAGGEQGLLGLAFHPRYATNGRLFVNYTRAGDGATVVSELAAVDGRVDAASERQLLLIEQPFANHNGGMIAFDASGYLLVGMGDGGAGGDPLSSGQDPSTLLGKLLRLDVDNGDPYGIPPDNGFAATDAHRPEIHAMGLRNPWRFSVDPVGGHVYVGDVGQDSWEEVSVLPGGAGGLNLGWGDVEGPECFVADCDLSAYAAPALWYGPDEGCTIIGGYVYRGTAQPALDGVYLFGDYCSGRIWGAIADEMVAGSAEARQLGSIEGSLSSFGIDDAGELYLVDRDGRILIAVSTEAT